MSNAPRILITAGPTHEPIDAVRYIANRSSGRMGIALANAAVARGWPTTLLLGPVASPPENSHMRIVRFQTTRELQQLLHREWPQHDVLFMAAAVADYTPMRQTAGQPAEQKLKHGKENLVLHLQPTPDLLGELAAITTLHQTVIGFALEPSERLRGSAIEKLARKKLDAIVANPLETMDAPTISATVIFADGRERTARPDQPKSEFADWLLNAVQPLAEAKLKFGGADAIKIS
jgi:phosphopantothenoylcysteine decarboxylase/phosphopantothenate--cysteine ligase